jgi:acetyltransferase-like isoleucine patch superfamily enzyme
MSKKHSCYVDGTVKVTGWSHVNIGLNSVVAAGTWLNVNIREGSEPTLNIGENCFIGRNNFITVGKVVNFGDYCLTATNCAFVGSSHNIVNPNLPYISTGVDADAEIRIGANCFFGYGAMVLGSVSIGYGSVIGAGAVVLKNVPPFSVVIGNPGRVVKRYSMSKKCWVPVAEYIEDVLLSEEEYVANMHRDIGYYPLPISAARSSLGDV